MSNSISIFGRLTGDPESRYSQNGSLVVSFTLADNRGDKASFFNCTAFGKTAENISKCLKGHRLLIHGRMEQDEWTDKNGQKQRTWKALVNDMSYVESASQQSPQQQAAPQQQQHYQQQPQQNCGMPPFPQSNQYNNAPLPGNQPPQPYGAPPIPSAYGQPPATPQGQNWNPAQPVSEQNLPF